MSQARTPRSNKLLRRARQMRKAPTRAEARLWEALRDRRLGGWKWRRQAPFGAFIVDFVCEQARLIVEVDGEVHGGQAAYDAERSAAIGRFGFRVLRFTNDDVLHDGGEVCGRILRACGGSRPLAALMAGSAPPSPNPLPAGEGF